MNEDMNTYRNCVEEKHNGPRRTSKSVVRPQNRQAASHVNFRQDRDLDRIFGNGYGRRIQHSIDPQHCPSCHCQFQVYVPPATNNKNCGKTKAELNQQLDCSSSKITGSSVTMKNNRRGFVDPLSPRTSGLAQQRLQNEYHRPRTSDAHFRTRDNSVNPKVRRNSRKYVKSKSREFNTRVIDSSLRDTVNSDVATEKDIDLFCVPHERMDSTNFFNEGDFKCHPPTGEPHPEPETNSQIKDRDKNNYSESKKRYSRNEESMDENFTEDEVKSSPTTTLYDMYQEWEQYQREEKELKKLREDLRKFVKLKNSRQIVFDLDEEDTDEESKQWRRQDKRREMKQFDESTDDNLEKKINRFTSRLPVPCYSNNTCSNALSSLKCHEISRSKTAKEQTRSRTRNIGERKTSRSRTIDRSGPFDETRKKEEFRRKDEAEVPLVYDDILHHCSCKDAEIKLENKINRNDYDDDNMGSETEQENLRESINEEMEFERLKRDLANNRERWKYVDARISGRRCSKPENDVDLQKDEKKVDKQSCGKYRKDEEMSLPTEVKTYRVDASIEDDKKDVTSTQYLSEMKGRKAAKRYRHKNKNERWLCNKNSELLFDSCGNNYCGTPGKTSGPSVGNQCKDEENVLNETREFGGEYCRNEEIVSEEDTIADEKIVGKSDSVFQVTNENHDNENMTREDEHLELDRTRSKSSIDRLIDNAPSRETQRRGNDVGGLGTTGIEMSCNNEIRMGDDYVSKTLPEILADHQDFRDCVRELKNRRWSYLNHIQSDLVKLYDLERIFDSWSPDRQYFDAANAQTETNKIPIRKESGNKVKECI